MTWLIPAALVALIVLYLASLFMRGEIRQLVRTLRWVVGGALVAAAAFLATRGQMVLAGLLGAGGLGLLLRGRLGPIDFGSGLSSPNNASTVSSHFFDMRLDHETGQVSGKVRIGHFSGRDLGQLSAEECWALYDEVSDDPDSLALYESWLDANRSGWREHFEAEFGMDPGEHGREGDAQPSSGISGIEEAYQILGLEPGAAPDAIKAAHRKLMKSVHPDAGGSAFLAAKINQAKDLLLRHAGKV